MDKVDQANCLVGSIRDRLQERAGMRIRYLTYDLHRCTWSIYEHVLACGPGGGEIGNRL